MRPAGAAAAQDAPARERPPRGSASRRLLEASGGECDGWHEHAPCPPRASRDDAGFERWLSRATERSDPVMAFLGLAFAMLAVFEIAGPGLDGTWRLTLSVATWSIWAVFLADFAVKLALAPRRGRYLRRNWLSALMLAVPTLRLLRFGALVRLGRALPATRVVSTSYRARGAARQLVRSRSGYLAGLAALTVLACAQLAWLAERGERTFATFGDALLWSAAAVVALQADPVPESAWGRLVMLGGFAVGVVLIASLAGTFGAYLLEDRRERQVDERGG